MKQTFLLIIAGMSIVGVCGYGAWLVIEAFMTMYRDWRLGREVRELEKLTRRKELPADE
jgi:hypothetical protein